MTPTNPMGRSRFAKATRRARASTRRPRLRRRVRYELRKPQGGAMLIGDKTGPAIIALTYGDVRPEHLLKQAQRIRLTVQEICGEGDEPSASGSSINSSNTSPDV